MCLHNRGKSIRAEHTDYQRKIDGYKAIFEDARGEKKRFVENGKRVTVYAFLYTSDKDGLPKEYRKYWFDDIGTVLTAILTPI